MEIAFTTRVLKGFKDDCWVDHSDQTSNPLLRLRSAGRSQDILEQLWLFETHKVVRAAVVRWLKEGNKWRAKRFSKYTMRAKVTLW